MLCDRNAQPSCSLLPEGGAADADAQGARPEAGARERELRRAL